MLLNTVLTVSPGVAQSHAGQGWERFTDRVISEVSARRDGVVFLLWGRPAQRKQRLIDAGRHHIIASAHPSPLSASRGFFGSRPFSRANQLLAGGGRAPIDWQLP